MRMQPVICNAETMTTIERETFPEYDHHQLAGGEPNQVCYGLNSRESEERCDPLPRESSRANEVTMEQVERCELGAIEGPSLGRLQLQSYGRWCKGLRPFGRYVENQC